MTLSARIGRPARNPLMRLFSWLYLGAVSDSDIRLEIWRLGGRHLGEPLAAALNELKLGSLSTDRRRLLRACVIRLRSA